MNLNTEGILLTEQENIDFGPLDKQNPFKMLVNLEKKKIKQEEILEAEESDPNFLPSLSVNNPVSNEIEVLIN